MPRGVLQCVQNRVKAELHLDGYRYFGSSKTVAPGALAVAAAFSPFASLHACVRIIADRLVIHNNLEQQMPVFMRCSSS
jgi:hypothetical protein